MTKIITVDVETTMNEKLGKSPSSPHSMHNHIVEFGVKYAGYSASPAVYRAPEYGGTWTPTEDIGENSVFVDATGQERLIVGQNVAFDLLYFRKEFPSYFTGVHSRIWDVQLAEYLLSAQKITFASLDELAKKYGGSVKNNEVAENYFNKGLGAEHVPRDMLSEYLKEDLHNTELVFKKQFEEAVKRNMLPLILSQMEARLATTAMQEAGMRINMQHCLDERDAYLGKAELETRTFIDYVHTIADDNLDLQQYIQETIIDIASSKWLSTFLYGGEYKYKKKEVVGTYKNGKEKHKLVEYKKTFPGLFCAPDGAVVGANGSYPVDEKALGLLQGDPGVSGTEISMLQCIIDYRLYSKIASTYYQNLIDCTIDGKYVHPSISHVSTKTGRLACNSPNLQNQTDAGKVKDAFISRYENGKLINFDYNQLEVVGLAQQSKDKQLIADIKEGRDLHTELYKDMYGRLPSKEERKKFKPLTFALIYGAGAPTMSANSGLSVAECRKFIRTFYKRYPQVEEWHKRLLEEAKENAVLSGHDAQCGLPIHTYIKGDVTGRHYAYREYYSDWTKDMAFSPTELKNYPVQGISTGDIVPLMVGVVFRAIEEGIRLDKWKFILTVHDSMMFDCREEYVEELIAIVAPILKNTPFYFERNFSTPMVVKHLRIGCEVGETWGTLKERI